MFIQRIGTRWAVGETRFGDSDNEYIRADVANESHMREMGDAGRQAAEMALLLGSSWRTPRTSLASSSLGHGASKLARTSMRIWKQTPSMQYVRNCRQGW
jgi:hypothetical protein